ncbi:MAG: hypothetical protein M1457_05030, partial [bacterium]|nr:hypothetical protein [bacterium]
AEAVGDGREGLIIEPGRPDLLHAAMGKLWRDPALRQTLGAAAAQRARFFSLGNMVAQTQSLYLETMGLPVESPNPDLVS